MYASTQRIYYKVQAILLVVICYAITTLIIIIIFFLIEVVRDMTSWIFVLFLFK